MGISAKDIEFIFINPIWATYYRANALKFVNSGEHSHQVFFAPA